MLKLNRRAGEKVMIGQDIVIEVIWAKANQVALGIDAPRHVEIYREEIAERIRRERSAGKRETSAS